MDAVGLDEMRAAVNITIAPVLVAVLVQALETGVIAAQLVTFWSLSAPSGNALKGSAKERGPVPNTNDYPAWNESQSRRGVLRRVSGWTVHLRSELAILRAVALYCVSVAIVHHCFLLKYLWDTLVIRWATIDDIADPNGFGLISHMLVSIHSVHGGTVNST